MFIPLTPYAQFYDGALVLVRDRAAAAHGVLAARQGGDLRRTVPAAIVTQSNVMFPVKDVLGARHTHGVYWLTPAIVAATGLLALFARPQRCRARRRCVVVIRAPFGEQLVDVSVVSWNSLATTCARACLRSSTRTTTRIASSSSTTTPRDETAEHVEAEFPDVDVVRCDANGGYGAGNNRGFAHSREQVRRGR